MAAAAIGQRVGAGAAVDRGFACRGRYGVVAAAGIDHVGAAAAVDRVVAGARRDGVGREEPVTDNAGAERAGIDVLEVGGADAVAGGLIDPGRNGEIDRRDAAAAAMTSSIGSGAAIDRGFGAAIGDGVIAAAGIDRCPRRRRHRSCRRPNRPSCVLADDEPVIVTAEDKARRVDMVWKLLTVVESPEVWSALARLTVAAAANHQRVGAGAAIDRGFRTAIGHGVVAGAGADDVGAAAAVDDIVARARS